MGVVLESVEKLVELDYIDTFLSCAQNSYKYTGHVEKLALNF